MTRPQTARTLAMLLFGLAAVAAMPNASKAGDFADLTTLGFSADAKIFAYEQSGVQDGSGFPYAEIFFLDLPADRFVPPSPVRVSREDEAASVDDVKAEARQRAAELFERYRPEDHPGRIVVDNPATELSADPHKVSFLPRAIEPSPDRRVSLRLETFPLPPGRNCSFQDAAVGYRLIRVAAEPGETARLIHEDKAIPESRGCPIDYRLSRVVVRDQVDGRFAAVAIIGVKTVGFEGPDLRFIANPVPMD
ncbi:DUF2259 domain-containing protein [Aurantimonas sp. VKM B-3413]|uniref:DUF2259 domain-containing protein n=1 Tax=Aurantimonas sp. VKM B-3413 TaxID=2779401 RepID=UPI001E627761|nr:DUF2259 domain-containing protein [Aurantimonas sp. VKM B-3413]MCB8839730.1 DUF2259 domain-containing protein [Aurantimonas sp. VKM B-3413]